MVSVRPGNRGIGVGSRRRDFRSTIAIALILVEEGAGEEFMQRRALYRPGHEKHAQELDARRAERDARWQAQAISTNVVDELRLHFWGEILEKEKKERTGCARM